jgi:lipoprotein NlpD
MTIEAGRLARQALLAAAMPALLAACASNAPAPVVQARAPVPRASVAGAAAQAAPAPAAASGPASSAGYYTVKRGDTLHSIALDQGLDYRDLAAWNGIENPDRILIGQQLRVAPSEGAALVAPVTGPGLVETHPLDGAVASPATLTIPQRAGPVAKLVREPKGGKQPYSETALASLQRMDGPQAAAASPELRPQAANPPKLVAMPAAAQPATQAPAPAAASPAPQNSDDVDWIWPATGKVISMYTEGSNKGIDISAKLGDPVLAAASGKVVYAGSSLRGYGKLVIVKHNPIYLSAYAHNSQILVKEGQTVARGQKIAEAGSTDSDRPQLHFEIRRQGKPVDPLKHLPGRAYD